MVNDADQMYMSKQLFFYSACKVKQLVQSSWCMSFTQCLNLTTGSHCIRQGEQMVSASDPMSPSEQLFPLPFKS